MVLVTNLVNHHDPWWIIKLVTYPAPSHVLVIIITITIIVIIITMINGRLKS